MILQLCALIRVKVKLSKQILQLQKTHAIAEYEKYCEETDVEGLCNRKFFDTLAGLKPAQQRIVAGLVDFVVEGIEAWNSLSNAYTIRVEPQLEISFSYQALLTQCQFHKAIGNAYFSKLLWQSSIKNST